MQFLSSMGAFLQQAAPMAMQFPDMRGLLGGIMMFTLRTFSASRPLEKEFENFQKKLEAAPPTPPPGQDQGDKGEAAAKATVESATIKAQADEKTQTTQDATKRYEVDKRAELEAQKQRDDHSYRMEQLNIERERLAFEKQKLGLSVVAEERDADTAREDKQRELDEAAAERERSFATEQADREDALEERDLTDELEHRALDIQEEAAKAPPVKPKATDGK